MDGALAGRYACVRRPWAVSRLSDAGVLVLADKTIKTSRCVKRLDELELISI